MNKALKNLRSRIKNIKATVGFSDTLYVKELEHFADEIFEED